MLRSAPLDAKAVEASDKLVVDRALRIAVVLVSVVPLRLPVRVCALRRRRACAAARAFEVVRAADGEGDLGHRRQSQTLGTAPAPKFESPLMSTTSFLRTALRARPRPRHATAGLGRYARHLSASVLSTPTQAALDDAEIDVAPLAPADARIELTDRAAEQLRSIAAKESNPDAALRIAVESGGCHGYQYKMELAKTRGGG